MAGYGDIPSIINTKLLYISQENLTPMYIYNTETSTLCMKHTMYIYICIGEHANSQVSSLDPPSRLEMVDEA